MEIASAWMESYFKRIQFGDHMPHTQQIHVHLPSILTKLNVHQLMMNCPIKACCAMKERYLFLSFMHYGINAFPTALFQRWLANNNNYCSYCLNLVIVIIINYYVFLYLAKFIQQMWHLCSIFSRQTKGWWPKRNNFYQLMHNLKLIWMLLSKSFNELYNYVLLYTQCIAIML